MTNSSLRIRYDSGVSEEKIGLAITHVVVSFCSRLMGAIRSLAWIIHVVVSHQFIVTETYQRVNIDSFNFLIRACMLIRHFIYSDIKDIINYPSKFVILEIYVRFILEKNYII